MTVDGVNRKVDNTEDNTCPLLPQPMQTDTHIRSLVHVSAAWKQVPHHFYVARECSREQRRITRLQVSTNTRKRQPFEAFELITDEVCNHLTYTMARQRMCACMMCVRVCERCVRVWSVWVCEVYACVRCVRVWCVCVCDVCACVMCASMCATTSIHASWKMHEASQA